MIITDLFEALTFSQVRPYMKTERSGIYDDIFERFSKYADRKKQRLIFPLAKTARKYRQEDFATANTIVRELKNSRISVFKKRHHLDDTLKNIVWNSDEDTLRDYVDGIFSLKGEERKFKIGKVFKNLISTYEKIVADVSVGKIEDYHLLVSGTTAFLAMMQDKIDNAKSLYARFQNDPARRKITKSPQAFSVIISRHPYDIAGASTGRGWTSCINLVDGSDKRYVASYVKNEHLIAYLVKAEDVDIKRPISRLWIVRYDGDGDFILKNSHDIYGTGSALFLRTVDRFCRSVNKGKDDGLYCNAPDDQYPSERVKSGNVVKKPRPW